MDRMCYWSYYNTRSLGYKYRNTSTNTGDGRLMDSAMAANSIKKFSDLSRAINTKIANEVEKTNLARESIKNKIEMVDSKINSILGLQRTVIALRKDLNAAENSIANILEKVEMLEKRENISYTPSSSSCHSPIRRNSMWEEI
ncbi:hypothetical protein RR48_07674 [Papilio machaon]|uniref:Uncharacterized protein n=1 Tax=Papilio machaon TaxID=76193 RepID=A0A194QP04_PAPMA|nr:hypothetical protein RR48_07674 [Papilio machaon]